MTTDGIDRRCMGYAEKARALGYLDGRSGRDCDKPIAEGGYSTAYSEGYADGQAVRRTTVDIEALSRDEQFRSLRCPPEILAAAADIANLEPSSLEFLVRVVLFLDRQR